MRFSRRQILLGGLIAAAAAQQPKQAPSPRGVPARVRVPASVEAQPSLVYARYGQRELQLDLYLPKGPGPFPAIVYIHGGAGTGQRMAFQRQAVYMATRGFAGACIDYRSGGEAKFPAAVQDAKAAVRWLRANAAKYQIRAERIGAAGGSAGGYLAAMLGTTAGVPEFEGDGGNPKQPSQVQAVAAFNPVVDLVAWSRTRPAAAAQTLADRILGATEPEVPGLYRRASPSAYVSKNSAPFLFLHGTADKLSPYSQSTGMMDKLRAAGVSADIFTAEGAEHGFFQGQWWFGPALRRMESFFTLHLKK